LVERLSIVNTHQLVKLKGRLTPSIGQSRMLHWT